MLPPFRGIYAHPVSSFQGTDKVVKRGAFHFISLGYHEPSPVCDSARHLPHISCLEVQPLAPALVSILSGPCMNFIAFPPPLIIPSTPGS